MSADRGGDVDVLQDSLALGSHGEDPLSPLCGPELGHREADPVGPIRDPGPLVAKGAQTLGLVQRVIASSGNRDVADGVASPGHTLLGGPVAAFAVSEPLATEVEPSGEARTRRLLGVSARDYDDAGQGHEEDAKPRYERS